MPLRGHPGRPGIGSWALALPGGAPVGRNGGLRGGSRALGADLEPCAGRVGGVACVIGHGCRFPWTVACVSEGKGELRRRSGRAEGGRVGGKTQVFENATDDVGLRDQGDDLPAAAAR